jgi:hypothetical protein
MMAYEKPASEKCYSAAEHTYHFLTETRNELQQQRCRAAKFVFAVRAAGVPPN